MVWLAPSTTFRTTIIVIITIGTVIAATIQTKTTLSKTLLLIEKNQS